MATADGPRDLVDDLAALYRSYVACLNRRDWAGLGAFVQGNVRHNERPLGLSGYRAMLEADVAAIPDLHFTIGLLAVEPPVVASRLLFDCTPIGDVLGLPVRGRRVVFSENVFYRYADGLIAEVWSVIDRAAIASQLDGSATPG